MFYLKFNFKKRNVIKVLNFLNITYKIKKYYIDEKFNRLGDDLIEKKNHNFMAEEILLASFSCYIFINIIKTQQLKKLFKMNNLLNMNLLNDSSSRASTIKISHSCFMA